MATKLITAFYTDKGVPKTGLTPTITITILTTGSATDTVINGTMVDVGHGWYRYNFTTYDPSVNYVFYVDGGASLDDFDRYKHGGNESYAEDITKTVLEEPLIDHATTGSLAESVAMIKADTASIMVSETAIVILLDTILKYQRNRTRIDTTNAQLVIYDDDGTTPLTTFDLKDFNGMPSVQEVCERIPHI
jgi:hypothetical protein